MNTNKKLNRYSTYALSELTSKALVTIITIGSVSFLNAEDYAKMGLALSWIGLLSPLFIFSADVSIIRYVKDKESTNDFTRLLFQAHFNIMIMLFMSTLIVLTAYNLSTQTFTSFEVIMLLVSTSVASLYTVRLRVLLFELSFFKASALSILPSFILTFGALSLLALGELTWQQRIILPTIGFCVAILLSGYYNFTSFCDTSRTHYQHLLNVAKWLTPQMIFNALYIYGDRIIASYYLNDTDLVFLLVVAQCAFLLSFVNRLFNTWWQTKIFNNNGQESSSFFKVLGLAMLAYLSIFLVVVCYFYKFFPATFDKLIFGFCIYSIGFFSQIYYHLNNAVLIWMKRYNHQLFISLMSGCTSICAAIFFYIGNSWEYFGVVFVLASVTQFLMVNFFLHAAGVEVWSLIHRSLAFIAIVGIYTICIFSIGSFFT